MPKIKFTPPPGKKNTINIIIHYPPHTKPNQQPPAKNAITHRKKNLPLPRRNKSSLLILRWIPPQTNYLEKLAHLVFGRAVDVSCRGLLDNIILQRIRIQDLRLKRKA